MIQNVLPFLLFSLYFYLVSFFDVFNIKISRTQRNFLIYCSLFLLVLFAGCRWSPYVVGYDLAIFDYSSYENVFNNSPSFPRFFSEYKDANLEIKTTEIGYILYSSFMRYVIGDSYNLHLLLTNLFIVCIFYRSIKNNNLLSSCLFFILFFYASRLYLQYNFILLRQAISLAIVWYSFHYLINGKKIQFAFAILIASTFHITALISFLSFFLLRKKINEKRILVLIIILFILNIFKVTNYVFFSSLDVFFSFLGENRLAAYLLGEDADYRPLNILNFVEILPFFYIVKKYGPDLKKDNIGLFYYNMFYCFFFLMVLTMNFGFLSRLSQYFMFSYIYLLGYYYNKIDSTERRNYYFILGLYFLIYSTRYIFQWFYNTPYSNFLFK